MPQNFLSPLEFRFVLLRTPNLEYYVQEATIPALTSGYVEAGTPFNRMYAHQDKLEYGDFDLSFRIDENMANYLEIHNWMVGLAGPQNFTQHSALVNQDAGSGQGKYSDATLSILNSTYNPNIEVTFKQMFPINLSPVELRTSDSDIQYILATVTFRYEYFEITVI